MLHYCSIINGYTEWTAHTEEQNEFLQWKLIKNKDGCKARIHFQSRRTEVKHLFHSIAWRRLKKRILRIYDMSWKKHLTDLSVKDQWGGQPRKNVLAVGMSGRKAHRELSGRSLAQPLGPHDAYRIFHVLM